MLRSLKSEASQIRYGTSVVSMIYRGAILVWSAITSCFGSGWWIDDAAWKDDEAWKD